MRQESSCGSGFSPSRNAQSWTALAALAWVWLNSTWIGTGGIQIGDGQVAIGCAAVPQVALVGPIFDASEAAVARMPKSRAVPWPLRTLLTPSRWQLLHSFPTSTLYAFQLENAPPTKA